MTYTYNLHINHIINSIFSSDSTKVISTQITAMNPICGLLVMGTLSLMGNASATVQDRILATLWHDAVNLFLNLAVITDWWME